MAMAPLDVEVTAMALYATSNHDEKKVTYSLTVRGSKTSCNGDVRRPPTKDFDNGGKQRRLSNSEEKKLPRCNSDIGAPIAGEMSVSSNVSEWCGEEITRCESCGLSEECTAAYVRKVREGFCGRWICGLCAEAVKEERSRMGAEAPIEKALQAHIFLCHKFNNVDRTNPAVHVAHAMRQLLKKKSMPTPRTTPPPTANLARSTSCIPAIK